MGLDIKLESCKASLATLSKAGKRVSRSAGILLSFPRGPASELSELQKHRKKHDIPSLILFNTPSGGRAQISSQWSTSRGGVTTLRGHVAGSPGPRRVARSGPELCWDMQPHVPRQLINGSNGFHVFLQVDAPPPKGKRGRAGHDSAVRGGRRTPDAARQDVAQFKPCPLVDE